MRGSGWDGTFFRFPKVNPTTERNNYRRPMAEHNANRTPKAKQTFHPDSTTEQATNSDPMTERNFRRNIDQSR